MGMFLPANGGEHIKNIKGEPVLKVPIYHRKLIVLIVLVLQTIMSDRGARAAELGQVEANRAMMETRSRSQAHRVIPACAPGIVESSRADT